MEAVAALGLASNVFQFVQFALGLLDTSSTIYQAATGAGAQAETLENVYGRLSQFSRDLDAGYKDSNIPRSRYEDELFRLAVGCEAKCQELLQLVAKLKVAPAGKRKAWKSLRAALLTVCHQDDFRRLEREIDGHQKTMTLLFTADISGQTSAINLQLHNLRQETASSQDMLLDQLNKLQPSLVKAEEMKEQIVLDSLDYQDRQLREDTIKDAHKATFEWIYSDTSAQETGAERHRFLDWLEKGDGYFWINGKPGAGKSTLMKFLTADERTHTALKAWAHPSEAVIASHYFWNSGSKVQRSHDGMLRSLLFDIFSQVPEVISPVCRHEPWWSNRRAQRLGNGKITPKWSVSSLTNCLQRLATLDTLPTDARFCLFIDGLDEYDGADKDSREMCDTLLGLTTSPRLKLCFSSRPSPVFGSRFASNPSRTLQVHELTAGDIERYTRDKIKDLDWDHYVEDNHVDPLSPDTSPKEHLIHQFVESVRRQAEGVFLWVFLVVRLVRNGLTNFDSLSDLRQYIHSLPSDITDFSWRMLDGIDIQYHQKMSEYLEIALYCYSEHWQVDSMLYARYAHDSTLPDLPQRRWTESEYWRILASIRRQLHAATGGLLEIGTEKSTSAFLGPRVNFLHSTARSFLQRDEVEDFLRSKGRDSFDPGHAFFTSFLSLCEHLPPAILIENGKLRASQLFALAGWLRANVWHGLV
ncbi:hypothetical protein GE09DRAFT_55401 [Coniochaeta sp. 2T2.1]|nr:hypothetical protein GE09DRAFT_55401 [Coniochaeta sp. 2T2.1]